MSAALTLGFAIPFALVLVVLLVVVVLIDRSDEADPQGRRPFAAYAFVIVFLTLFTALFAVTATTNSLMHIVIDDSSSSEARQAVPLPSQSFSASGSNGSSEGGSISIGPSGGAVRSFSTSDDRGSDDARWRDVVRAGLLAAVAVAVLLFHAGMARRAAEDAGAAGGRARRIYYAYLYATMALAVIVIIGAATAFGYAVFKVLAPGVASTSGIGKRKNAVPDLVTTAVLLAGAGLIFRYHFSRRPTDGGRAVAALPPPPPPPEPEAPAPPPRRPAKRATAARKSAPRRSSRTE